MSNMTWDTFRICDAIVLGVELVLNSRFILVSRLCRVLVYRIPPLHYTLLLALLSNNSAVVLRGWTMEIHAGSWWVCCLVSDLVCGQEIRKITNYNRATGHKYRTHTADRWWCLCYAIYRKSHVTWRIPVNRRLPTDSPVITDYVDCSYVGVRVVEHDAMILSGR